MVKTIRFAILLVAILCIVPGCDDETDIDPNGPCDPATYEEAYRCMDAWKQACRDTTGKIVYGDDPPGTWEYSDDCGGNLTCRVVDNFPECVYVDSEGIIHRV